MNVASPAYANPRDVFGETAAIRCERTAAELRAGRPVVVTDGHRRRAALALDSTSPAGFTAFAEAVNHRIPIIAGLTGEGTQVCVLEAQRAVAAGAAAFTVHSILLTL